MAAVANRTAQTLSVIALLLAIVISAGGVFLPGLYRDAAWLVPQTQGQDFVTLAIICPALAVTLLAVRRGSQRAALIWIGLLGYLLYAAIGAAFAYAFNPFFPLYIALFSITVFALTGAVSSIDIAGLAGRFSGGVPRKSAAAFLTLMALMLSLLWLSRMIPALSANPVPDTVEPFKYVFALDLGLIVPLSLLGAIGLWGRRPLGYLVTGCMLIKAAAMGLALLAMTWWSVRAGLPTEFELTVTYVFIACGGLGLSTWFFRSCRG